MQVVQHDGMCRLHHITTNKTIHLGLLYQPPEGSILQFCKDLATYMEVNINEPNEHVLLGKIVKIGENLQHIRGECSLVQSTTYINETCNLQPDQLMKKYTLVDHKDVIKFIRKSPSKGS